MHFIWCLKDELGLGKVNEMFKAKGMPWAEEKSWISWVVEYIYEMARQTTRIEVYSQLLKMSEQVSTTQTPESWKKNTLIFFSVIILFHSIQ